MTTLKLPKYDNKRILEARDRMYKTIGEEIKAQHESESNFLKVYIKPKPKWMPKFVYKWLLGWVVIERQIKY